MVNSRVNFVVKIPIRCWDTNKTPQGITFICRILYSWISLRIKVHRLLCRNLKRDLKLVRCSIATTIFHSLNFRTAPRLRCHHSIDHCVSTLLPSKYIPLQLRH